ADPEGSILTEYHETGNLIEPGSWVVEGIGEDFIPDICEMSMVDVAYTIPDKEALQVARDCLLKEGIMGGSSSGTLIAGALRYCRDQREAKTVVTLACDTGNRYLSKMYNDDWMKQQGFID
ncbi:MAG: pyridoxal-phosphate dependent enzyme, partial [Kangiellaceae bacterium]|nr:pyridoxal-phosphate dependent enzyme [Kangiellaceae bacterium]